jgi:hypothetical protein
MSHKLGSKGSPLLEQIFLGYVVQYNSGFVITTTKRADKKK